MRSGATLVRAFHQTFNALEAWPWNQTEGREELVRWHCTRLIECPNNPQPKLQKIPAGTPTRSAELTRRVEAYEQAVFRSMQQLLKPEKKLNQLKELAVD
jgi:hypothetical protein